MKISIIIPTYNEESTIEKTLRDLRDRQGAEEVIVVDGGSGDKTVSAARQVVQVVPGTMKVISVRKGRARQMNAGANHATGDFFLFLHADTLLPRDGLTLIRNAVRQGAQAGRFRMRFDEPKWLLKFFSLYTRFHCFSYGDQGFFVAKKLFRSLNGFRTDVPFEDIDFYKRLRRAVKPVIIEEPVVTSARRFIASGSVRQKLINIWLVGLYGMGFNVLPAKEKLYPDIRT